MCNNWILIERFKFTVLRVHFTTLTTHYLTPKLRILRTPSKPCESIQSKHTNKHGKWPRNPESCAIAICELFTQSAEVHIKMRNCFGELCWQERRTQTRKIQKFKATVNTKSSGWNGTLSRWPPVNKRKCWTKRGLTEKALFDHLGNTAAGKKVMKRNKWTEFFNYNLAWTINWF